MHGSWVSAQIYSKLLSQFNQEQPCFIRSSRMKIWRAFGIYTLHNTNASNDLSCTVSLDHLYPLILFGKAVTKPDGEKWYRWVARKLTVLSERRYMNDRGRLWNALEPMDFLLELVKPLELHGVVPLKWGSQPSEYSPGIPCCIWESSQGKCQKSEGKGEKRQRGKKKKKEKENPQERKHLWLGSAILSGPSNDNGNDVDSKTSVNFRARLSPFSFFLSFLKHQLLLQKSVTTIGLWNGRLSCLTPSAYKYDHLQVLGSAFKDQGVFSSGTGLGARWSQFTSCTTSGKSLGFSELWLCIYNKGTVTFFFSIARFV